MVKTISVIMLVVVPLTIGLIMSQLIDAVVRLFRRGSDR